MTSLHDRLAAVPDGRLALVHGDRVATYADLVTRGRAVAAAHSRIAGSAAGLCTTAPVPFVVGAVALDLLGADAYLVGESPRREAESLSARHGWAAALTAADIDACAAEPPPDPPLARRDGGAAYLLTSGTTGTPKAIRHTWSSLAGPVRVGSRTRDDRWLLVYPVNRYAGVQVLLQALLTGALAVRPRTLEPLDVIDSLRRHGVTHASATPTFWRRLLLFAPRNELERCDLRQITLGGEIVDQQILDRLAATFPNARLVHIYASTEHGRLFGVRDGREGFPASYLSEPRDDGVELTIREGELWARSQHGEVLPGRSHSNEWRPTGDLVEVRGDRVHFLGRDADVINVGGHKVMPGRVERELCAVGAVEQARVYPKPSSLVGQIVAADVVLVEGTDTEEARRAILAATSAALARHEVPQLIRFVDDIPATAALKLARSEAQG